MHTHSLYLLRGASLLSMCASGSLVHPAAGTGQQVSLASIEGSSVGKV